MMDHSEQQQKKQEKTGKTGVIPNDQISGSDADKAYDQEGNFMKQNQTDEQKANKSDTPEGSDAAAED